MVRVILNKINLGEDNIVKIDLNKAMKDKDLIRIDSTEMIEILEIVGILETTEIPEILEIKGIREILETIEIKETKEIKGTKGIKEVSYKVKIDSVFLPYRITEEIFKLSLLL
jgi:hypothetical protein